MQAQFKEQERVNSKMMKKLKKKSKREGTKTMSYHSQITSLLSESSVSKISPSDNTSESYSDLDLGVGDELDT
jgi:hypothetical protein